ncbi:AraC family transcriptional regulator [Vallitalea guaymasensis]|uniref:AraC family transcriptional regulator n=1 Tax=Vallitalea guaymasensis TaxID=1185412 RepID=UPI002357AE64|nr:AraC family transcriptional regulator [Vallitalea guaymasensis]
MFIGNMDFSQIFNSLKITDMSKKEEYLYQESKNDSINYSHYPYELEKRLYQAIITGNIDELEKVGYEYSNYPSSVLCENNSIRSLKNNMICSCALITRMAIETGLEENYAYFLSDLYINKIESLRDEESLLNLNAIMILDFMTQIKNSLSSNKKNYSPLTKEVIKYINDNLCTNFTLTDVADHVNANSSYLSRTFKKEVGTSFTKYIHMNRIKKAKHLLLFTNLSLVEISARLGYTTQSHFSKIFKQISGMTPNTFKQNHIKPD